MSVPTPAPAAQLGGLGGLTNLAAANGAAALGLMGAAPGAATAGERPGLGRPSVCCALQWCRGGDWYLGGMLN